MAETPILHSSTRNGIPWLRDTRRARESALKRELRRDCFSDRGGTSYVNNYYMNTCSAPSAWTIFKNTFAFSAGNALASRVMGAIGGTSMTGMGMCGNPASIFMMGGGFC